MKYQWTAGVTDRTILVFLQDSSSTTGAGLAGIAAADMTARYIRVETDNDVTIATLSLSDLSALTDAHSDGGWLAVDATNAPGWYRLDVPDAVAAAGAWHAGISIIDAGANDIAQWTAEIELVGYNTLDTDGTSLTEAGGDGDHLTEAGGDGDHLTAIDLPNQTMDITGDITGNVSGSVGSVTGAINTAAGTIKTLDSLDTAQDSQHSTTQSAVSTVDGIVDSILALLDDARSEPGQTAPPVNPDLATKIDYLYKAWRNKKDNDGSTTQLYADDGSTVDQKQSTSESGGTVTKAEWITGA